MRTQAEGTETEAEYWARTEERRRRIYEELWHADEERVRRQRERDPYNNRRRQERDDRRNPFEIGAVKEIPRATQVLGVRVGATEAEIKAAYKRMAMAWHPDRPGGSAEKMKDINQAREILLRGL
jgi:phage-related minor tail protein